MTPAHRVAALRLADALDAYHTRSEHKVAAALLRELALDQVKEPEKGEQWHIRRPGAIACVTMEIVEVTPKTLLMKPVRDPFAYPERLLRSDTVLIEPARSLNDSTL